jgi:hypothetical protein
MRDIKFGSAKDEIVYQEVIKRAFKMGIFPEGHPGLNDYCELLNKEISNPKLRPYHYSKNEEPWTEEEINEIKVLKM